MPVREIVRYPDPRLKQVCEPIGECTGTPSLLELADDLLLTMRSFPGCVGIAAPQVGELVRMVAIDVTGNRRARSCHGAIVLVDPVVTSRSGSVVLREGCLSIPDFTGDVRRAEQIELQALAPDGTPLELTCDAWEARVVLHELDHLDGILFLDRVESARHVYPRKRYREQPGG